MKTESNPENQYTPGICNIGEQEIRFRKLMLAVATIVAFVFTYLAVADKNSMLIKAILFLSVSALVVTYIQVKEKFCVSFGWFGFFNFNERGKAKRVRDEAAHEKDKQKVTRVIIIAIIISLIYTSIIGYLPSF